jgi:hypothetical protein
MLPCDGADLAKPQVWMARPRGMLCTRRPKTLHQLCSQTVWPKATVEPSDPLNRKKQTAETDQLVLKQSGVATGQTRRGSISDTLLCNVNEPALADDFAAIRTCSKLCGVHGVQSLLSPDSAMR